MKSSRIISLLIVACFSLAGTVAEARGGGGGGMGGGQGGGQSVGSQNRGGQADPHLLQTSVVFAKVRRAI